MRSRSSSQAGRRRSRQLGVDLVLRAALDERAVQPLSIASRARRRSSALGPEQEDVDARDHLRDVLVGDVGQVRLAEDREGHVGAVPEQQELEVVLPHQVAAAQRAV